MSARPTPLTPTVFLFCRLGDMVMLTVLLNLLHQRYGRPCRVVGTGSWTSAIYAGNPDVEGVWAFHRHLPFLLDRPWLQVRRALRDSAPGPVYVCERHYRQLPRIRRMLRLSGVDPRRVLYLTDPARPGQIHLVDLMLRLGMRTPRGAAGERLPGAAADGRGGTAAARAGQLSAPRAIAGCRAKAGADAN